jgi:hypothetical protein
VVLWTSDTGIDGENPVELDEMYVTVIDSLPSYVWYQDTVDFESPRCRERARWRRGHDAEAGN